MKKLKSTLINGHQILRNAVLVLDDAGVTVDIIPEEKIDFSDYEVFDGYIVPGFVNAHCHLELSHLKNKLPKHTGLVDFVMNIMSLRNDDESIIQSAMAEAEKEMLKNGIVAVGDISNSMHSFELKSKGNIYYHTFLEGLGFTKARADAVMEHLSGLKVKASDYGLKASISPHAPYSISRELFSMMADVKEDVYSLHHLESLEEIMFLKEKTGAFLKLYDFLKINIDEFEPLEKSATLYWLNSFEVDKLLLVHNTFLSNEAFELIQEKIKNVFWCLCPNANLYIENRLPNIPSLIAKGAKICIGTDSLASNDQLDVLEEIRTIKKHFPEIETEYLLQCASIHGAEALGIEDQYGQFFIGRKNPLLFVTLDCVSQQEYFTQ